MSKPKKNVASPIAFIKYILYMVKKKLKSNVFDSKGWNFIGQAQIQPRCQSQTRHGVYQIRQTKFPEFSLSSPGGFEKFPERTIIQ